jgi:hypothetical protein
VRSIAQSRLQKELAQTQIAGSTVVREAEFNKACVLLAAA